MGKYLIFLTYYTSFSNYNNFNLKTEPVLQKPVLQKPVLYGTTAPPSGGWIPLHNPRSSDVMHVE